jgi:ABC-type nitrate/sulfonate/bicarbonate transport system permease component
VSSRTSVPTPLSMLAFGWAFSAALAFLFISSFYPIRINANERSKKREQETLDHKAEHDISRLTPEEEVLLLHVLE